MPATLRTAGICAAAFLIVRGLYVLLPDVFVPWNAQSVDQLFRLRSNWAAFVPRYDSTIIHVNISDQSLAALQHSYLNRIQYARTIQTLSAMGASAVAIDFIFPARTNPIEDSLFMDAVASAGNVYLGMKYDFVECQSVGAENPGVTNSSIKPWQIKMIGDYALVDCGIRPLQSYADLARRARGNGFLTLRFDRDRVFRRVPLLVKIPGGFMPSFPLQIVCDYLSVADSQIVLKAGESVTMLNARFPNGQTRDVIIPIDAGGNLIVNYIGPWEAMIHKDFAHLLRSADDQFEQELMRPEFEKKIVILADVSTGSSDVGHVPVDPNYPLAGLHANVINTILTGNFLSEVSGWRMLSVEFVLLLLIYLVAMRSKTVRFAIIGVAVFGIYLVAGAVAFLWSGLIVNLLEPSLMILLSTALIVGQRYMFEAREKALLRRSFEAYFPPSVVKKIMLNPAQITASGQKKELTILFSDIKGFTSYAAMLPPDLVQRMLNEYFDAMVEIVFRYEGTVDKFIGDGLMVFFGDPEPQSDHAVRAVRAAIDMQKKVAELRKRWSGEGKVPIEIRIGINSGEVIVGNMGSARRLSYTVLGSEVNLAQRLESNAPTGGILIADRTNQLLVGKIGVSDAKQMTVKGLVKAITVYEVVQ